MKNLNAILPELRSIALKAKRYIDLAENQFGKVYQKESYDDLSVLREEGYETTISMIAEGFEQLINSKKMNNLMFKEIDPIQKLITNLKEKIEQREKELEFEQYKFSNIIGKHCKDADDDMRRLINLDNIFIVNIYIKSLSEEKKQDIVERMKEKGFLSLKKLSPNKYSFLCEIENPHLIESIRNHYYDIIHDIIDDRKFKRNISFKVANGADMIKILV